MNGDHHLLAVTRGKVDSEFAGVAGRIVDKLHLALVPLPAVVMLQLEA